MSNDFTVLIVDDDFFVASLHASYVDNVPGFSSIGHAGTIQQALKSIHSLRPDLILMDIYLPDGSGLDVLRQADSDVLILSAASDENSVRKALRRGALGYLTKPFTEDELAARLRGYARYRRILEKSQHLDQATIIRAHRALIGGEMSTGAGAPRSRGATESSILEALAAPEPLSAVEVATAVGVSRATAQRYLSALADDGAVEIQLRYGSTGRPEHRYRRQG